MTSLNGKMCRSFQLNKVLQEKKIPGEAPLVKALTAVLTASQRYMREQTVGVAGVQAQPP